MTESFWEGGRERETPLPPFLPQTAQSHTAAVMTIPLGETEARPDSQGWVVGKQRLGKSNFMSTSIPLGYITEIVLNDGN